MKLNVELVGVVSKWAASAYLAVRCCGWRRVVGRVFSELDKLCIWQEVVGSNLGSANFSRVKIIYSNT